MKVRLGRIAFKCAVAKRKDPLWWTTDASGTRVNTLIGIQAGEVPLGATIGGRFVGFVVGPIYLWACLLNKVSK